ncbi:PGPGW domain-containing protein, partial [Cryptosporangium minutisporangium]
MAILGAALIVVGVLLLVLPGPGLLLVLAGLLLLASEFPWARRYVEPVRERAMQAADASVSSPWRLTGSVAAGLFLIGAGIVWGVQESLPFGGWGTGTS